MRKTKPTILAHSLAMAFAGSAAIFAAPVLAADDDVIVVEVTAQSRHQQLSDVPLAIQVVTAKDIETLGAKDLSQLNGYIPGFTADNTEPTEPVFSIRGVQGGGDFGIGTDSPVGIYEDGVYTGKTGGAMMNFIDVQRIEVIKGPQGTLFGRNSAAGAISIVTNEPTQDVDALLHVTSGAFGTHKADLMLNAPLTDTAAVRFVFARDGSRGWVKDVTTDQYMGGNDDWATRLSFKDTIAGVKLNLGWEHEEMNQDGRPAFGVVNNPNLALPFGGFNPSVGYTPAYIATFSNPLNTPLVDSNPGSESRKFDGITLRAEAPIGNMTLNSTTGYRIFETWDATDNTGTNNPYTDIFTLDAKKSHSIQQEFKLSGKNESMDWISGISYYSNQEQQISAANTTTGTLDTISGAPGVSPAYPNGFADPQAGLYTFAYIFGQLGLGGVPGISSSKFMPWAENEYSHTDTKSWSVYGDTIWHLDPKSNLTFGLRWSEDEKTMTWFTPPRVSTQLDQTLNAYAPQFAALIPANVAFYTASLTSATPISSSKTWTNLSPRLVLDHKYDKDTMVFASLSQGYQAGGFNVFTPPVPTSPIASLRDPSFSPEKMTNLETGIKMALPNLNASLNSSLFAYRFNNLQNITLQGNPGEIPTYNVTTSDQKAYGWDLDGRIKPVKNLTLFTGFEFIDATFTKYSEEGTAGGSTNLAGQPVGTPYFTGMAGMNLKWELLSGHAEWTFQGTHTSEVRRCSDDPMLSCLDAPNIHTGSATNKFDTRLGWQNESHQFGVALLVNNVFNQRYVQYLGGQLTSYGVPYATITPPRYFGVEFTASM